MSRFESDTTLAPEDRLLVERVREAYAPSPLSPGRAAAFDAELRRRVESRGRRGTVWVPASALAAAVLAAWVGSSLWHVTGPDRSSLASVWESQLILSSDVAQDDSTDYLPADYAVIAEAFLDQ